MKRLFCLLIPLIFLITSAVVVVGQDSSPRTCQITATYSDKAQCDVYEADASSAAFTLTLIAPAKRRSVVVVKTDTSNNAVTVATAGTGATINGQSSYVLRQEQESAVFYANGRNGSSGVWRVAAQRSKAIHYAEVTISSANITGTSAGQFGHASGYPLVAAPGVGVAVELLSAVIILDYDTAAYTGGGNVTVNYAGGGAALTGTVSAANSVGGSADKVALVLATAPTNNALSANTGLNLVAASAFTQPGTAAGVVRVKVSYRLHTTGL